METVHRCSRNPNPLSFAQNAPLVHLLSAGRGTSVQAVLQLRSCIHVSVHAHDLEESARFYKEIFRMEEIPAPDFPFPVLWLRVGDLQLHLFQSEDPAPQGHHFGIDVDDFEAAKATLYLRRQEYRSKA